MICLGVTRGFFLLFTQETAESIQFSANTTLDHGVNEVWLLHGALFHREIGKSDCAQNPRSALELWIGPGRCLAGELVQGCESGLYKLDCCWVGSLDFNFLLEVFH